MKSLFIILLLFCCSCNNSEKKPIINKNPKYSIISFSKTIADFGTITNDTFVKAIFYIKNIGNENLIIGDVIPECSCTGYTLDNDTIVPGDSTRLLVNFNTKGKELGLQKKVISVRTNTKKEYNSLFIKCRIIKKDH